MEKRKSIYEALDFCYKIVAEKFINTYEDNINL